MTRHPRPPPPPTPPSSRYENQPPCLPCCRFWPYAPDTPPLALLEAVSQEPGDRSPVSLMWRVWCSRPVSAPWEFTASTLSRRREACRISLRMRGRCNKARANDPTTRAHAAVILLAIWPWCFVRPTRMADLAFRVWVVKKRVSVGFFVIRGLFLLDINGGSAPHCSRISGRHAASTTPRIRPVVSRVGREKRGGHGRSRKSGSRVY